MILYIIYLQYVYPSTQYRYYGKLHVAVTDGDDTALLGSFTRVCFVKFICLIMLVILFCNLVCVCMYTYKICEEYFGGCRLFHSQVRN